MGATGVKCLPKAECDVLKKTYPDPLDSDIKPASKVEQLTSSDGEIGEKEIPIMAANGKQILKMKIKNGGLKKKSKGGNETEGVNLAVSSVPDSELTNGPRKNIYSQLLSPVFNIVPDSEVEGEMEMNFPILDEAASANADICTKLLKLTTVWYSSEKTNNVATQEDKPCDNGDTMGNFSCVCKMTVSHFTEFTTGPYTASQTPAEEDKGLGAGAIAGIVVGVLVVVALVAAVLTTRRKSAAATSR